MSKQRVMKCDRCGKEINGGLVYQGKDINGKMHYLCMDCIIQRCIEIKNDEEGTKQTYE